MNLSGQVLWKRSVIVAACERATIGNESAAAPVAAPAARNLRREGIFEVLVVGPSSRRVIVDSRKVAGRTFGSPPALLIIVAAVLVLLARAEPRALGED